MAILYLRSHNVSPGKVTIYQDTIRSDDGSASASLHRERPYQIKDYTVHVITGGETARYDALFKNRRLRA